MSLAKTVHFTVIMKLLAGSRSHWSLPEVTETVPLHKHSRGSGTVVMRHRREQIVSQRYNAKVLDTVSGGVTR